jgi:hypothetical protein
LIKSTPQEEASIFTSPEHLSSNGAQTHEFYGLNKELCFVAPWLKTSNGGYSKIYAKDLGKDINTHCLVANILVGKYETNDKVLHRCGNRKCHNPYHLYIGGDAENERDKLLHRKARTDPTQETLGSRATSSSTSQRPPVLSQEISRLNSEFDGFNPIDCFNANWLYLSPDGYMQLNENETDGELFGAYRKIFSLFIGHLDRHDIVSHSCNDKTCLNPYHLSITGRYPEDRDFAMRCDKRRKVTESAWIAIKDPNISIKEISEEYGLHPETIRALRRDLLRTSSSSSTNSKSR